MRHLRPLAAILLAAALLAGCGGGSDEKDGFSQDYKPINDELLQIRSSIGEVAQGTNEMLAGAFGGFATRVDALAHRLDALKPPGDLRVKRDGLAAALILLGAQLKQISTRAAAHDAQGTREATERMVIALKAADGARRALARETGAKVGP
jgi:hypothetical protein